MFRKLLLVAPLAIALGGCPGQVPGTTIDPAVVTQVQQAATTVCGYLPAAETVAQILAALAGAGPVVGVISQAANGICSAVTSKGVRRGLVAPRYRGVAIQGQFVR